MKTDLLNSVLVRCIKSKFVLISSHVNSKPTTSAGEKHIFTFFRHVIKNSISAFSNSSISLFYIDQQRVSGIYFLKKNQQRQYILCVNKLGQLLNTNTTPTLQVSGEQNFLQTVPLSNEPTCDNR